jgi:HEAT repeat protein
LAAEPEDEHAFKVSAALSELAKGLKGVAFYPPGHPSLVQLLARIVSLFEAIPLPEGGIEVSVAKGGLSYRGVPVPSPNRSLIDFNRDLYLRRVSKLIFLPGLGPGELSSFLSVVGRDPQQILDDGGLEKVLPRENVAHVWINRVDYASMTELLKKEQGETEKPEEVQAKSLLDSVFAEPDKAENPSIEALLDKLSRESSPSAYRNLVAALAKAFAEEKPGQRLEYLTRAFSIFLRHFEQPPGGSSEIGEVAERSIREMSSDEMVAHYIAALRSKGRGDRSEAEKILVLFRERSVRPLLDALGDETDLLVRKSFVEILTRIGRPAVPVILENLNDSQWFVVRNMLTILGSMGMPELAPQVAAALANPDVRVKREAIKALARLDHPTSVAVLGDLFFDADESVALAAVAAMASKRNPEAVLTLYRRAVKKELFYPNYRFAQEAIDALRTIGTDEAVAALGEIIRLGVIWQTRRFRETKLHALQAVGKVGTARAREKLREFLTDEDEALRAESKRLLRNYEP